MENDCKRTDCKFVFLDTKKSKESLPFNNYYKRTDTFFCEKCLAYKDKTQTAQERYCPEWYGN